MLLLLPFFLMGLSACGSGKRDSNKLTLATAANMQFAIQALTEAFTTQSGIDCEIVVGASGKLTSQIQEGAPFDVFVSADMKYPQALFEEGYTEEEPAIYGYGRLILWTLEEDLQPSLALLVEEQIQHIALADPEVAPYGKAAVQVLKAQNQYNDLYSKFVYGESVGQTHQFITSRSAEMGFTSASLVLSPQMKGQGQWIEMDANLYDPIAQGVVVIGKREDVNDPARQFQQFLFSQEAREILTRFGYKLPAE